MNIIAIPVDVPDLTPIQVARRSYLRWKSNVQFEIDLRNYLEHGIVISRPDIFAMAKVIPGPEPVLFVRVAVGNLRRLLYALPLVALVPKIRFCRRNDGRVREYSVVKMLETADRTIKKET